MRFKAHKVNPYNLNGLGFKDQLCKPGYPIDLPMLTCLVVLATTTKQNR
jgi:hypothetical protein